QRLTVHLTFGEEFSRRSAAAIGSADLVYAFNSATIGLKAIRKSVSKLVMEQTIVPKSIEDAILREASDRWPDWALESTRGPATQSFARREMEEWEIADLVVCGSEFVASALRQCGVQSDRIAVLPYGFSPFRQISVPVNSVS